MTKQQSEAKVEADDTFDPQLQLLYDHIKFIFIANARKIAEGQKPETLLKMIQSCKQIQPIDSSQKELWRIVRKVRHELLVRKDNALGKPARSERRRTRNRNDHQ